MKNKITAKEFFFDGCHKIYLIEDEQDKLDFFNKGWSEEDIYPIDNLPNIFDNSCSLRFINTCKLKTIVPQFAKRTKFMLNNNEVIL